MCGACELNKGSGRRILRLPVTRSRRLRSSPRAGDSGGRVAVCARELAAANSSSWCDLRPAFRKCPLFPGRAKGSRFRELACCHDDGAPGMPRGGGLWRWGCGYSCCSRSGRWRFQPGVSGRQATEGGERRRAAGRSGARGGAAKGTDQLCRQAAARAGGAGGRGGGGTLHRRAPGRPQLRRVRAAVSASSCVATPPTPENPGVSSPCIAEAAHWSPARPPGPS